MNTYQYTTKDKNGRTVVGILNGAGESEVVETLHKRELVVISVELVKPAVGIAVKKSGRIKHDDLVIFTRQLSTLIDAGIPLVRALMILSEQVESRNLRNVVLAMHSDIEAGASFHDALSRHPNIFSELFVNMVKAGEASGMLDEVLERLAAYLEKTAALTRKIQSSLVYPAVIICMTGLITAILLLKVVPTFKGIFEMLGGDLPLPTQILIGISDLLRNYLLLLVGFSVALGFLFKRYINTVKGRYNFDMNKLKVPVLGPLFRKLAVAKFSRTFSTLVRSGVSILNALNIVSKTSGNKVIEEAVLNCSKSVREGEPISKPLSKSGVFPPMVCHMISVGEQTGQLEKMLSKIADFYEEQVDAAASALTSMIEPIVILFLGIVIGGIVISLFLPILKITQLIAK